MPPPPILTEELVPIAKDEIFSQDGSLKVGHDIEEITINWETIQADRKQEETSSADDQNATVVCFIGPDSMRQYVRSEVSV